MGLREGKTVEFKREMGASAVKTVVAFANTGGGTLYIGVGDDGIPVGLEDLDGELTRVASSLRDSIKPDVLMMTSIGTEAIEGVDVVVVRVGRGTNRPYYLAAKGPRPEGVFIRAGAASVPASDTSILGMIKESEGDSFESHRAMRQGLTFDYAIEEFARKGLALGESEMRTFGLADADGAFTNLGLILSDQCPPMLKAASFSDDERGTFLEREEYDGSILAQLARAYAFLEGRNRFRTEFEGLNRVDLPDYPAVALREALVNSVAHREYALSGPTLVSVMPSAVEIVSLGGLPVGIEYEDLSARISMPRNRMLANVLFRLELIEAYGTGIGRMRQSYSGSGLAPRISVTANTFSVSLPNRNALAHRGVEDGAIAVLAAGPKTRAEIQRELGVSQATAVRMLSSLVAEGKVVKEGAGRTTRYRLPG